MMSSNTNFPASLGFCLHKKVHVPFDLWNMHSEGALKVAAFGTPSIHVYITFQINPEITVFVIPLAHTFSLLLTMSLSQARPYNHNKRPILPQMDMF